MHSHDVDDIAFGIQTDRYTWVCKVLQGECSVEIMIEYFERNYPNDERAFIDYLKELKEDK
jgi:hypothetical protein